MGYAMGLLRTMLFGTVLLTASSSLAAELRGRASTQYLWFNNIFDGNKQAEFAQHLNFSLTDIDPDKKLSLHGYGRLSQDVMNGEGLDGRLFYLYADYRDLMDKLDVRLGRQFVNYAAGSSLVDGGMIDLKNIGPVAFSVMGGRNVFYGIDGELTNSKDWVFGTAAYLTGYPTTDAELSYYLKFDKDGIAREQIGAMFRHYMFGGLKVYGNTRFDMASETFDEVLAGAKYFVNDNLVVTGEWFQSYPVFDYTSIYSVFAVDRYQEGVFRTDYTINKMFAVRGAYKYQDFGSNTEGHVFEAGLKVRPIETLMLDLAYDRRQGYAGNLNGFTVDVQYDYTPNLQLAGGAAFDVYQKDSMTGDTTAQTYWLGTRYRLNKTMSFDARLQDNVNIHRFDHDWSGRIAFNYDF